MPPCRSFASPISASKASGAPTQVRGDGRKDRQRPGPLRVQARPWLDATWRLQGCLECRFIACLQARSRVACFASLLEGGTETLCVTRTSPSVCSQGSRRQPKLGPLADDLETRGAQEYYVDEMKTALGLVGGGGERPRLLESERLRALALRNVAGAAEWGRQQEQPRLRPGCDLTARHSPSRYSSVKVLCPPRLHPWIP